MIIRHIFSQLEQQLQRGKSILLLGPRQAGKTTLLEQIPADLRLTLVHSATRTRYEKSPELLIKEVESLSTNLNKKPLIILDEIQKVPGLMDNIQYLIDRRQAQFVLTGSSARKLRRASNINLLPGRVVQLRLDPLVSTEYKSENIQDLILNGTLPAIWLENNPDNKEKDLATYVQTYLDEEVRAEALVRNVGVFARFLEWAGLESGKIINFSKVAQEVGVSSVTIKDYYEILVDCLVAERIDPYTKSRKRTRLTKASRYLIFDMGVRRLCAQEGNRLSPERLGELFEHFIGLECVWLSRLSTIMTRVMFWRDTDGPEVDWIIERNGELIPIEVKWSEQPDLSATRGLRVFIDEYPEATRGYVVCRTPRSYLLTKDIQAIPWQELYERIFK